MNTIASRKIRLRTIVMLLIFITIIPFLPLLITGRWNWWEAWAYAILNIGGFAISRFLAARRHPDIIVERAQFLQHKDTKKWDKILAPLVGLGGGLIPLMAGLNVRFEFSPVFNIHHKTIALVFIIAGFIVSSWALIENRFFSGTVRIQTDRGQCVVSSGPYRLVRHPGYSGALLAYLFTPVLLDAPWAFIPVAFIVIILAIRTQLEDSVLQNELTGYREYAQTTRYRLIPGLW